MNQNLSSIVVIAILLSNAAFAQDTLKKDYPVTIQSVENYCTKSNSVGLGDYISLKVNNISKLISSDNNQNNSLTLYLHNLPMRGIPPTFIDTNQNLVVFPIIRVDSSKQSWDVLYHKSARKSVKPVEVSVGINDKGAIKGGAGRISLKVYNRPLLWTMLFVYLFVIAGFLFLASKSIIVRDGILDDKTKMATFSLAKSQLAWWTLIIVGSVGYIFSITGELPIISGSTWVLLAISIGTTVGAKIINIPHQSQVIKESKNWITDILSDNDGISIHRFQMFIWTIFIGIYFIYRVFLNLDIPQLSSELLALMGISNGTYLGLKIPEDKIPSENQSQMNKSVQQQT
jgi:hypothetical protein